MNRYFVFELLATILPLAAASTIAPGVFGVALAILAGKYPIQRSLAYLLGAIITVIILAGGGYVLASNVAEATVDAIEPAADVNTIIGILFIIFGVFALIHKDGDGAKKLAASNKSNSPKLLSWFLIGLAINITNFDSMLLNLAAVKIVFQSEVGLWSQFLSIFICGLFFLLPILLPLVLYLLFPERAKEMLRPVKSILAKYGKYLVAAIFFIFGIILFMQGTHFG